MPTKFFSSVLVTALISALGLLIFFELVSLLNNQWLTEPRHFSYPYDAMVDWQQGLILETLISSALILGLGGLTMAWFQGGLGRIIANGLGLGLLGFFGAVILAILIFNAWTGVHIVTLGQWMKLPSQLIPHTKPYQRFWFSNFFGGFLPVFFLLTGVCERLRQDNKVLGNAHFARGLEIHKAGFFDREPESIVIGKKFGVPLFANGFEHVLVFAPSGSGKTRSISMPNLFNYPYSVVCNDIKFTLFNTTSGYRQSVLGHVCYCFAPARASGVTHRFNPLSFISQDSNQRITDIQRTAHSFMPDNPKADPIWSQASRKLFKSLVLYLLDTPERPTTLGEINRLVKQQNFDDWLQDTLDTTNHYDPEFYRNGYSYINNHEKTRSSILESFSGYFELFDDPVIDAATSDSDFDLRDLRKKKMTIYVGFTDEDMERLAPLLTLFWQQLISAMIREVPCQKTEPYPLLCLIDEFSSLGRIERLRRSLKLLREYRVRCILMFQYIAQTYEKYSHDEAKAFINIKTKVAYTTEDIGDAEFISKILGTRTKKIISHSITHQHQGISDGKSISYQAIPLLRPDEIMKMPTSVALIIRSGHAPLKAKQFIWYKESTMSDQVKPAALIPKQTLSFNPFTRQKKQEERPTYLDCLN